MTPQVWTYADVQSAIIVGLFLGVIGTLTIQFIFKAILFPILDWFLDRAQRRVTHPGVRRQPPSKSVNSLAIKDTQS